MIAAVAQTRTPVLRHRLAAWRDAIRDELRRRDEMRRTISELRALTTRELDDLGIARCDIRRLARESVYGA
jgi:uncharacterized protein YjiS (DUF1127 family)